MVVGLLLVAIWAAVLVPPAVRAHTARRDAFVVSFDPDGRPEVPLPLRLRSFRVQRRRRILKGLLIAMAGTGLGGLLPTFRVLLVVFLFLVDSFLAYVALLAHSAGREARRAAFAADVPGIVLPDVDVPDVDVPDVDVPEIVVADVVVALAPARRAPRRRRILVDLPPIAPVG